MEKEESTNSTLNIKEYIINSRKAGYTDDVIIDNLKKSSWPDDIIQAAVSEADQVIPSVQPSPQENTQQVQQNMQQTTATQTAQQAQQQTTQQTQPTQEKKQDKAKPDKNQDANPETKDIFTKPPTEGGKKEESVVTKKKGGFSLLSLIALIFSPIPFVGFYIAMSSIEDVRKNKKSGLILALLALIINIAVIGFILWAMFQIFTLNPEQLTGFSKFINDKFNLV